MKLGETRGLVKEVAKFYSQPPSSLVIGVCTALVIASIAVMAVRLVITEHNLLERTQIYEKQAALIESHLDEHRKIVYRNHALLIKNANMMDGEVKHQQSQLDEMEVTLNAIKESISKFGSHESK